MTVTIPDTFRDFVAAQIAAGNYPDVGSLICALLQQEQARKERASINQKLIEALDGSEATEMTRTDWDEIRAEVQRRHSQRNGSRP